MKSLSAKELDEQMCVAKCGKPHHHAVSRVITDDIGGYRTRRVVWYCCSNCRDKDMRSAS